MPERKVKIWSKHNRKRRAGDREQSVGPISRAIEATAYRLGSGGTGRSTLGNEGGLCQVTAHATGVCAPRHQDGLPIGPQEDQRDGPHGAEGSEAQERMGGIGKSHRHGGAREMRQRPT